MRKKTCHFRAITQGPREAQTTNLVVIMEFIADLLELSLYVIGGAPFKTFCPPGVCPGGSTGGGGTGGGGGGIIGGGDDGGIF